MKRLLFLLLLWPALLLGVDAANDVVLSQRKADNSGFIQRNVPAENAITSASLPSFQSAIGFGTEDSPTFSGLTLSTTPLAPASGGTGLASYTVGDLIYASGATTLAKLADVAVGSVLLSGGVGAAPSYGGAPAGTLTGTTLASNVVTSSITTVGALTSGSIGSGFGAINVGANSITGGPGSFTTLSATGNISATGSGSGNAVGVVNNINGNFSGVISQNTSTGTAAFVRSGNFNSANGCFLDLTGTNYSGTYLTNGVAGQSANFFTTANIPLIIGVNSSAIAAFSSTGLAVTGTLSATYAGAGGGSFYKNSDDTSDTHFVDFQKASGAVIGSITRVTTTDAVAYNTTSDGRLKTNIRDFTAEDSGRIIDGLKPRWFDWKASDLTESYEETIATGIDDEGKIVTEKRQKHRKVTDAKRLADHAANNRSIIGFIAQEEAAVDPALVRIGAVTVGDDDPETINKQWQRSDSALIPILVAELKSLRARVAELEAKSK